MFVDIGSIRRETEEARGEGGKAGGGQELDGASREGGRADGRVSTGRGGVDTDGDGAGQASYVM